MHSPKKTKEIVINGNTYSVSFPTNKVFIAIYARKAQLSKEMHDALNYSLDGNAKYASMLIDAIATFENIMPVQFFKDLNVQNLADLDVLQGAELVKVYRDQYEDWFIEWTNAISAALKGKVEEGNVKSESE